jgi:hypothetical protein
VIRKALGIGRPGEPAHLREGQWHIRSLHASPWSSRFRFGGVLGWNGPYWHRAIGVAGPDWDNGEWLGGTSWHRHGIFAACSWRRRGSMKSDITFERNLGCSCQGLIRRWLKGRGTITHRVLCARVSED